MSNELVGSLTTTLSEPHKCIGLSDKGVSEILLADYRDQQVLGNKQTNRLTPFDAPVIYYQSN